MNLRDTLIRGSQKVIQHYQALLRYARSEHERQHYRSRIAREEKLIEQLTGSQWKKTAA
jgi:hypothetical protein